MNFTTIARRTTITLGLAAAAFGLSVGSASAIGDADGDYDTDRDDLRVVSSTGAVAGDNTYRGLTIVVTAAEDSSTETDRLGQTVTFTATISDGGGGGGGGGVDESCWDWTDAETGKTVTECH